MAVHNKGFTLIELVIVIVLLGIVGTFSFQYLGLSAKIFSDTVGRDQLLNQSRFAVERLSRELRNALPRSVRVNSFDQQRCIEFVPIITSSSYVQIPRLGASASNRFIAVTPIVEPGQSILNQSLFVYATTAELIYGNSLSGDSLRRKTIASIQTNTSNSGLSEFTFTDTEASFPTGSPARRFFITEQPVSWCLSNTGTLDRFTQYGFFPTQRTHNQLVSLVSSQTMAQQLYNDLRPNQDNDFSLNQLPFNVESATLQRNSLVQIDFRFGRSNDSEPLRIQHEVFVPNVP